jgi:predicted RNA-binding Zn ribbon-like protein
MASSQPATPAHVQLVLAAANTVDVENHTDTWATRDGLANWLREHTGAAPSAKVSAPEHAAAVAMRDGLRRTIAEQAAPDFGRYAATFPLRLAVENGAPVLAPTVDGPTGGVAQILAAMARSSFDGTWQRIKICPADDCQWAFFDQSRNRSRSWCSMQVCGNRTKTRTYRARHHEGPPR